MIETLIAVALGLQEIKDGAYTNEKLGVRLALPKDWKLARGGEDALCTFSLGEDVEGDLECDAESDRTPEQKADEAEKAYKDAEGVKSVTRARDEKLKRAAGEWLRREVVVEHTQITLRYVTLYVRKGASLFTLTACCDESDWGRLRETIAKAIDGFALLEANAEAAPNPWAGCAKGSWARYRATFNIGAEARMPPPPEIRTVTLVERDADSYTVRTDRGVEGGKVREGAPEKIALAKKEDAAGKVETGEETLTISQKPLKCAWTKTTRERGWVKVWTCDEVPGRVVKREENDGGGRGEVMTLVEFEKK